MRVWPLDTIFSVAHLSADWLPLSLSMAMATKPLVAGATGPLCPAAALLVFELGSHMISSSLHFNLGVWVFHSCLSSQFWYGDLLIFFDFGLCVVEWS